QAHTQACPRRFSHLAIDQGSLIDNAGLLHLQPQVIALTGALAHPGEHREAPMLSSDVADQLHDDNRLADPSTAKQAGLTTLGVWFEEIDDLDARLQHLRARALLLQRRRRAVDGIALLHRDWPHTVHGFTHHVQDTP